jgi:tetratricopeptide (TPR) repeat protein
MRTVLRNLLIVTFMAVCVAACGPSPEELYQQGVEYYNNKDYTKAAECFSKAAKKGHTESEKYLAMMFEGNAPAEQTKEEEQIVEEAIEMEIIEENEGMIDDGAIEQMIVEEEIIRENDKPAKEEKPVVKENKPQQPKAGAGFSVSSTKRVYFAKGNLQYQASTKKWRFADNQWDVLGEANSKISDKNNGWIDLFGWGTGSNPTKNSTNNKDYTSFSDCSELLSPFIFFMCSRIFFS